MGLVFKPTDEAMIPPDPFVPFGSPLAPLRASNLASMKRCPSKAMLSYKPDFKAMAQTYDGDSSAAADTGTAAGLGVELYHRRKSREEIRETLEAGVKGELERPFVLADLDKALRLVDAYVADPRNPVDCVVWDSLEKDLRAELPPHELDPTGQPIFISGHTDQIRLSPDGNLEVWDIKVSRFDGYQLRYDYAWQLAAYQYMLRGAYPYPVSVGGIIRLTGYTQRKKKKGVKGYSTYAIGTEPVFFRVNFSEEDCNHIIDQIRLEVAMIRRGEAIVRCGEHCRWCPGDPFKNCAGDANWRQWIQEV